MDDSTNNDKVELLIDGTSYGGWQDVEIERSIEKFAGSFQITLTERWPGLAAARPLRPGKACQVKIGKDIVITGYVDDYSPIYNPEKRTVSISGRDKTGDLVDCSAIHKSGQWRKVKLDRIIRDLISPFGISLVVETTVGKAFSSFNIEEGETVFECCDRAARLRAVILTSNAAGNLVITNASNARADTSLIEGKNILECSGQFSWKDRFSKYVVKGQKKGTSSDPFSESTVRASSSVKDESIDRYRPLIVISEDHATGVSMGSRAAYEKNVRFGKGNRATVTVRDWRQQNGKLWAPNMLVPVKSPSTSLDAEMLIVGCKYSLKEDSGKRTVLSVARPEAFDLVARGKKKKESKGDDWSML